MEAVIRDIRYSFKRLLSNPGSNIVIILTLAFGIGANTAIFSAVNSILFRDLPFDRGDDIVELRQEAVKKGLQNTGFSVAEVNDYRNQSKDIEDYIEYHFMYFFMMGQEPALVRTGVVSANFFDFLGIKPLYGRSFVSQDDGLDAEPVIMLSYDFWQDHYKGDENVIGQLVEMNDKANRIIGILPRFIHFPESNDIYMPTMGCPTRGSDGFIENRNSRMMKLYGRKGKHQSLIEVNTEVGTIASRMHKEHQQSYPDDAGMRTRAYSLKEELTKDIKPSLYILIATTLLVLLITCTNVINLSLAQQSKRQKELAIKAALGSSKWNIVRQLLCESLILSLIGGLLGLLIAFYSLDFLIAFVEQFSPRAKEIAINKDVLLFNLGISLLTGVIVGLIPALGKEDILTPLKEGGTHATMSRQKQNVRKGLIISQVAIAFLLLSTAGLVIKSYLSLQSIDLGFESDNITVATIPLNWSKYENNSIRNLTRQIQTDLKNSNGIEQVAITTAYPFGNGLGTSLGNVNVTFDDRVNTSLSGGERINFRTVGGQYFQMLDIELIAGRFFRSDDDENNLDVALISESVMQKHWPSNSPINKRISFDQGKSWVTIVGVVSDVKQVSPDQPFSEEIYLSYMQFPNGALNLMVKSSQALDTVSNLIKSAVAKHDPGQPINQVISLSEAISMKVSSPKMVSQLLSLFSALALAITAIGISGLLAFSVSQRVKEIGIRVALGAEPADIRSMFLKQGSILIMLGLVIGLVLAVFIGEFVKSVIYGVSTFEPVLFAIVGFTLFIVGIAASWLPASRACKLDPNHALKS
ncbi:predicted permease [Alteromonas sp. 76-1]|jgi:putative ABC transport system permease protein|uniref:ABC transporter permease n=1 Tax=Alteromonas sp. 76-1 TaxID=2358187 RepID=UPI000FD15D4A|nr:ABC transporter permease [Alteromonas sp. 76-1]VEL98340.1 predicted permease [Alteromonas sp. 76-1]